MDEITDLADRLRAKRRRGEEPGLEFEPDFASLTDEERDAFLALMYERIAHAQERLEAIEASVAALKALLRLQVRRARLACPSRRPSAAVTSVSRRSSRRSTACPTRHERARARGPRPGAQGVSSAGLHV